MGSPLLLGDSMYGGETASSEEIRRMLARELHDQVAQTLTTMLIELENFKTEQKDNQSALRQLGELQESTRDVLTSLRRVLYDLRGEAGIEEGFAEAVQMLLARFQERTQVEANLSVSSSWPTRLRSPAAHNLYRIIEEALTNVRLHSGARLVEVALGPGHGSDLSVEVRDDGRGSDSANGHGVRSMGFLGMRERALILGGRLEVESVPGRGTTIRAVLPKEQLM